MYGELALYVAASVTLFSLLDSFIGVTTHKLTTIYGGRGDQHLLLVRLPDDLQVVRQRDARPPPLTWIARVLLFSLTALWVGAYVHQGGGVPRESRRPEAGRGRRTAFDRQPLRRGDREARGPVRSRRQRIVVDRGQTVLEVAEANGLQIEAGCRMGVCGADPVAIVDGMSNISEISDDEAATLERLGLAENTRMACCCRIKGPISVSLDPETASQPSPSKIARLNFDRSVERVVVIGNGIAGITAADYVRRNHPECSIDIVADEIHELYNRMAITRLVYGRSAMQGLYLNPDSWSESRNITLWLNTRANAIDREKREVLLGTQERLAYDRLILATGSSSFVPPIDGWGAPGSFVLRSADDALEMRAFIQVHGARRAVVAGGGLLGLEAAYALHKLGLATTVLERSDRLLRRQLDERAAELLLRYIEGLGHPCLDAVRDRRDRQ